MNCLLLSSIMYTMIVSYNIYIRMTRIKLENYNGIYSSNFLFITDHRNKSIFLFLLCKLWSENKKCSSLVITIQQKCQKTIQELHNSRTPENNPGNQANWRNYTRIITHCWRGIIKIVLFVEGKFRRKER